MDDAQIINLYFARNENAIVETKNKYQNMCYIVAYNILYSREDSEECVNDTWLFTWNSIPPRRPSILSSFVSKITRNTAIDRYRKRNAQKRMDSHMEDIAGEVEIIGSAISSDIEIYLKTVPVESNTCKEAPGSSFPSVKSALESSTEVCTSSKVNS